MNSIRNFESKGRKKDASKRVRIDITQIPSEGSTQILECLVKDLSLDLEEVEFTEPIQVIAQLKREVNFVRAEGEVKGNLRLRCSRCLEDFIRDFSYGLNLLFSVKKEDTFIDITENLREEIILNHPFKVLCKSDCKGLCPLCGQNLNKGRCNCGTT